jgi:enamine deaminase RidA (YjgF/YER057c/UK114 family)
MKLPLIALSLALMTSALAQTSPRAGQEALRRIGSIDRPGRAAAVQVPDVPLMFTGQIFAGEVNGDARVQAAGAHDALVALLAAAGAGLGRVVRLTGYASDEAAVAAAETLISERYAATPVACSIVRTPLTQPGAVVAWEAVATLPPNVGAVTGASAQSAVLPAGGKIFISGQAERGPDLGAAVKATMAGLHRSLADVGLQKSAVVQLKAFIRPFADQAAAQREIAASFDGAAVPPVVFIEWRSELFAEIELVAAAPSLPTKAGETVAHWWLPWLTPSPRYCHVAHVPAKVPLIFVGAIDGGAGDDRAQMKRIFEQLGSTLYDSGSSFRHLVKATYYLGGTPSRTALGEIRGVYFDPTRPPSASALQVAAFARPGRTAEIEMIAVPAN